MTCEINSTVITENKKAIQTIYKMLWDIIALYEPTDAYNSLPNSDDNTDCRDYMDAQILNVRKELSSLFINDQHLVQMLEQIINETEIFVKSYELPGVAMRWKKINKALIFFDCAFDILVKNILNTGNKNAKVKTCNILKKGYSKTNYIKLCI